jgi:hypothetical protein
LNEPSFRCRAGWRIAQITLGDLVGAEDEVAKSLFERLRGLDARIVEASPVAWLQPIDKLMVVLAKPIR